VSLRAEGSWLARIGPGPIRVSGRLDQIRLWCSIPLRYLRARRGGNRTSPNRSSREPARRTCHTLTPTFPKGVPGCDDRNAHPPRGSVQTPGRPSNQSPAATDPRTSERWGGEGDGGHTTIAGTGATRREPTRPRLCCSHPLPTRATSVEGGRKPARSAPGGSQLSRSLQQAQKVQRAAPEQTQRHRLTQPPVRQQRSRQHTKKQ